MSREHGYLRFVLETGRTDMEYLHSSACSVHSGCSRTRIHARDPTSN